MDLFNKIIDNINESNYSVIFKIINTCSDLDNIINLLIDNIESLKDHVIEQFIKIILSKIINLNGSVNTSTTKKLYEKLSELENTNVSLLDKFILLYDEQNKIRMIYLSLIYQFLKSFNKIFPDLNKFLEKEKLVNEDIEIINSLITEKIHTYFQAIFDLNYNKQFFKRITDCSSEVTKNVNSNEMIDRMLRLTKILGFKMLHKLKIELITVRKFYELAYIDRVKYFRLFYIKTYSLFKLYNQHYSSLIELENKISILIRIDPLDYIDNIEDSSSSFILSDELLNVNFNSFHEISDNDINFQSDQLEEKDFEDTPFFMANPDNSENNDTPMVKIIDENNSSSSNESSSEDEFVIDSPENYEDVYDIFVKE